MTILSQSRYNACLKAMDDYRRASTDDPGVKDHIFICIRKVIEANLKHRFLNLIESKIPIIHQRMCGTMIREIANSPDVKSTDHVWNQKKITDELQQLNNTVSPAAHIDGVLEQHDIDYLDRVQNTSPVELNALIGQALDMINNKLLLLVYTTKDKKKKVKVAAVLSSTTAH